MSDVLIAPGDAAPHTPAAVPEPVLFTGDNGEFRRLVTQGALLELVTAGFYRFWLATRIRRYLWSSTVVGGDAPEYLGTPRELLFGFFFAIAILAPVYLAYFLLTTEVERRQGLASLPLGLFFAAFGQFAIYRARRYRLHRTSWRGLRFSVGGSGLAYMARAMGWGALVILTLGLALPWAEASLERYKLRNTAYGDLDGDFVGRGGEFFKRGWWIWATIAGLVLVIGGISVIVAAGAQGSGGPLFAVVLGSVAYLFGGPLLYAAFKTVQWRWWLEGLRLGEIRVETNLQTGALIGNYFLLLAIFLGLSVTAGVLFGIAFAIFGRGAAAGAGPSVPLILALLGVYLVFALAIGVAVRIYLTQRVWKIIVSSLRVHHLALAESVAARESGKPSAIAESFTDSLDVVGF